MATLQKAKYEAFALALAQGKSQADAAIAAGYKVTDAASRGCRLAKNPIIQSRVAELKPRLAELTIERVALATSVTKAWIVQELISTYKAARDDKQLAVARGCLTDIGEEMFQMFVKRQETTHLWDGDLGTLNEHQMGNMKQYLLRLAFGDDQARMMEMEQRVLAAGTTVDVEFEPAVENQNETEDGW